jgi:hypothetical protein
MRRQHEYGDKDSSDENTKQRCQGVPIATRNEEGDCYPYIKH